MYNKRVKELKEMGKYQFTYEEKLNIVRARVENYKTLKAICEEYDISKSHLCRLLKDYREHGKESLKNTKYYSAEYKLKVIKRHFEDGISIADLTRETGVQYRMLKQWFSDYQHRGEEGLTNRKRGRPRKPQPNTPEEKIRQLEIENEVLRAFLEECERWDAKNSGTK
ncbi:MAG: helix-turn-helix domain-containing protein [Eubacteriales bacterium]|nr:helix-turn-helix domain-containing protein [Eubacteriales bacterium]